MWPLQRSSRPLLMAELQHHVGMNAFGEFFGLTDSYPLLYYTIRYVCLRGVLRPDRTKRRHEIKAASKQWHGMKAASKLR